MKLTYEQWKRQVDNVLLVLVGLESECLPDVDYSAWYRQGVSPTAAAKRAIKIGGSF